MDLTTATSIAHAVRRHWWLAALVLAAVLAVDIAFTVHTPRTYLARASLLIGPSANIDRGQLVYSVDALGRSMIVGTYANMLTTDTVRREALTRAGVSPDETDSAIEIKTAALAESALVQVSVVAAEPGVAAAVANAVGQVGEVRMSQFYPIYDLTVVTPAAPPTRIYQPDIARNLSLGLLVGALLATVSACMFDALAARASRHAA